MQTKESLLKKEMGQKEQMIRQQKDTILAQKSEIERQRQVIEGAKSCAIL